jgi:hypothetical protein
MALNGKLESGQIYLVTFSNITNIAICEILSMSD